MFLYYGVVCTYISLARHTAVIENNKKTKTKQHYKRMNKYLKWGLVAAIAIGAGIYGFNQLKPKQNEELTVNEKSTHSRKKELTINAKILKPQLLTDEILTVGRLVPDEEVQLTFEAAGKITGIFFKEGSHVKKGTLLAKSNDTQLQAQLKSLEAKVPLAEERVYRQSTLLERDAVSKEALEIVKTELATLNAEIDKIKAQIEMTELHAPFDGIIGLRQVSVGTYASPSTVVATLTSVSPIKVEFSVAERYAKDVKSGTNLTFTVDGFEEEFTASVYATESSLDAETHNLTVRALYPNTDGALMPGQYAGIKLKQKEIPDAISVPAEAIVPEMGKSKIFVYRNGFAEPVDVVTGLRTDAEVQIISGLQAGDTILTSGTLQLRKGSAVKLDKID